MLSHICKAKRIFFIFSSIKEMLNNSFPEVLTLPKKYEKKSLISFPV